MNKKYILLAIFLLGFILRFWFSSQVPPGLNRDEASIGYNAYSLLTTGKDEYGTGYPLSFKSFGDWKLPLYIYLTMPFVKIFGLTDTAVRMPSILAGTLTVLITFFLARELFKVTTIKSSLWEFKLPALSAFLLAISPWSIHLSRTTSEANLAVFFTSLGFLLYLRGRIEKINLIAGTFFLVLPLYIYHANHIFTPLLFLGLTVFFWRKNKSQAFYWISIAVFVLFSFLIYSQTLFSADKTKISGLFITGDPAVVYGRVITDRLEHENSPQILVNLAHNKIFFAAISAVQNYLKSYSPEFLFITGGGNEQHNIPNFGNLYLWEAPFLLLGLFYLLIRRANNSYLILFWIFIVPLASSFTKDAPHTARMTPILPVLDILIALGFLKVFLYLKRRRMIISNILTGILCISLLINFFIWNDQYFIHFPLKRASVWGEGYAKLVSYLSQNRNFQISEVVMSRPEYSPYIYFLFYGRVDPLHFQNSVIRYPETGEGFQHVSKIDEYSFRQIDWSDDLAIPDRVYIEWSEQLPKSATASSTLITKDLLEKLLKNNKDVSDLQVGDIIKSQKIGDIKLQNGSSMFTIIKTAKMTDE